MTERLAFYVSTDKSDRVMSESTDVDPRSRAYMNVCTANSRRAEGAQRVREMHAFYWRHKAECGCDMSDLEACALKPPFCLCCIALLETPHADLPACDSRGARTGPVPSTGPIL